MVQPSTDSGAGTYSKRTSLFDLHLEFEMVLFAGYEMPVQYSGNTEGASAYAC